MARGSSNYPFSAREVGGQPWLLAQCERREGGREGEREKRERGERIVVAMGEGGLWLPLSGVIIWEVARLHP